MGAEVGVVGTGGGHAAAAARPQVSDGTGGAAEAAKLGRGGGKTAEAEEQELVMALWSTLPFQSLFRRLLGDVSTAVLMAALLDKRFAISGFSSSSGGGS